MAGVTQTGGRRSNVYDWPEDGVDKEFLGFDDGACACAGVAYATVTDTDVDVLNGDFYDNFNKTGELMEKEEDGKGKRFEEERESESQDKEKNERNGAKLIDERIKNMERKQG